MLIINVELIMLFIIVLTSVFISMAIIILSACVILSKRSRLIDLAIHNELRY